MTTTRTTSSARLRAAWRPVAAPGAIEGPDPLGGLEVRRLVAQGASQSAGRLATYLNAVQPRDGLFDAFFLLMYFGGGTPLEVGDALMTVAGGDRRASGPLIPEGLNVLRDDLGVRVMVVNTECEASSCYGVRQPDTDHYRYWEIAGASHVTLQGIISSGPRMERDFGFSLPIDDAMRAINQVSPAPVVDAALHHLQAWLDRGRGAAGAAADCVRGDPPAIVRDADGIARGGIRLPAVEVPVAHNSAAAAEPRHLLPAGRAQRAVHRRRRPRPLRQPGRLPRPLPRRARRRRRGVGGPARDVEGDGRGAGGVPL